jgi:hypothetical protein
MLAKIVVLATHSSHVVVVSTQQRMGIEPLIIIIVIIIIIIKVQITSRLSFVEKIKKRPRVICSLFNNLVNISYLFYIVYKEKIKTLDLTSVNNPLTK